jgi:hypothetical protein
LQLQRLKKPTWSKNILEHNKYTSAVTPTPNQGLSTFTPLLRGTAQQRGPAMRAGSSSMSCQSNPHRSHLHLRSAQLSSSQASSAYNRPSSSMSKQIVPSESRRLLSYMYARGNGAVHVVESVDHYLAEPRSFPATEPDCGFTQPCLGRRHVHASRPDSLVRWRV